MYLLLAKNFHTPAFLGLNGGKIFVCFEKEYTFPNVYIERSGNLTNISSVADRKKYVILKYLQSGEYTRVRMIDDDVNNLKTFMLLGREINRGKYKVKDAVMKRYPRCSRISFFPLLVNSDGKIRNIKI